MGRSDLKQIKQNIKNVGTSGLPMRLRLFLFLVAMVITMALGVVVLLLITGTFTAGIKETEQLLENELNRTLEDVYEKYGQLSVQAVELSKGLSGSLEQKLREQGLDVTDLQSHPEVLEDLIGEEYQRLIFSLQRSKSSGVFLILNATSNPKLERSPHSRAGLYIKNMEPNIVSSLSPTIILLHGSPSIGRKNSLPLHAQWSMEFDISDAPYYRLPMEKAVNASLPLSRLYYWSPAMILPGTSEEVMLCSVPLIDSKGNVFGVCGFDVSAMLFKLTHMPDSSKCCRVLCLLAPISKDGIDPTGAMFSGGHSGRSLAFMNESFTFTKGKSSFYTYTQKSGDTFVGLHKPVRLYPDDSTFADQRWVLALVMPEEDLRYSLTRFNLRLALTLIILMALGAVLSVFLSSYYTKPIAEGLDILRTTDLTEVPKTKVPEIDDLIEFLSMHSEGKREKSERKLPSALFNEFLENTKTLSPAERAVFNLYVKQHTAKEIADILCLSINTIKTHNKRIYTKLNVASREELLLYVNMLKEAGEEF